jgi:hypothetical protein
MPTFAKWVVNWHTSSITPNTVTSAVLISAKLAVRRIVYYGLNAHNVKYQTTTFHLLQNGCSPPKFDYNHPRIKNKSTTHNAPSLNHLCRGSQESVSINTKSHNKINTTSETLLHHVFSTSPIGPTIFVSTAGPSASLISHASL